MFGPFALVDYFLSILPFFQLQPPSLNKKIYPGLETLTAWTLQQWPVGSLPAAFNEPTVVR